MSRYIPVNTPGGVIWVEIEDSEATDNLVLTGVKDKVIESFEETAEALKHNANYLLESIKSLSPQEVEITCGIKIGVEGGMPLFCLAKASGEANYSISIKWQLENVGNDKDKIKTGSGSEVILQNSVE